MSTLFLHFILFLFTTSVTNLIPAVQSNCIDSQKQSLLHFKKSLVFDSSGSTNKLLTWNSSTDCCSWLGVTCSTNGRVVGLDLSSEYIFCSIDNSSSLFQLQHLQSLNLASNSFNGSSIPSAIGKLTELRYLNLSFTYFSHIPIEVARLTKLKVLDLSSYNMYQVLTVENPNLGMLFQNHTELEELYLDSVDLSRQGSDWCEAISSSLPKLRVLSLSWCSLSGPICESLAKLKSLYHIHLSSNPFYAPVPRVFSSFSNLTFLSLDHSCLLGTFPKEIFQIPSLQTIDLSWNSDLHGSFPIFPNNGSLRSLDVRGTRFSGNLPNSIGNLKMMSSIQLSKCNFTGSLPQSIENLTELVDLDISWNMFNSPINSIHWETLVNLVILDLSNNLFNGYIPSSVVSLPKLETFTLSDNKFSGQVPEFSNTSSDLLDTLDFRNNNLEGQIPTSIFNLQGLEFLYFSSNNLSGFPFNGLQQQPRNLRDVDLSHNNLLSNYSSTNSSSLQIETLVLAFNKLRAIPNFLRIITLDIQRLDLSGNQIQGQMPSWILSQKSLTFLDLSHNSLVSLEAPLSNSTSALLIDLDLHSNKLQEIQSSYSFFWNQSDLTDLDLSENRIQGQIPNWIWTSKKSKGRYGPKSINLSCNSFRTIQAPLRNSTFVLSSVDLHSNQLQGQIPLFLTASYLDYSKNNFNSGIPNDIGDFIYARSYLSLSSNNLHGVIPESICNASGRVLDLSNNSLSGNIPQCLSQDHEDIHSVFDLSRNKLIGSIPDNFPKLCQLQTLDLSRNQIQGQFPKSLVNCRGLEVLNLGNNYITDNFPCVLMNISTLKVLALRSNKFYGSIECPTTNDTWQVLQILDLAHNNFSGDFPGKISLTWQAMVSNEENSLSNIEYSYSSMTRGGDTSVSVSYVNAIRTIIKGLELDLIKILTIFTMIDFSFNKFNGSIPEEFGELKSLYVLNLSNNAFTGKIPSSFGKMRQLESLDLSKNYLSGQIPPQFASLSFLAFLDLSYNELVGKIPTSTQFSTFPNTSFKGNKGLWGPPLTVHAVSPPPSFNGSSSHPHSGDGIDWDIIIFEVGFTCGFGIVVGSLLFCKRWRKWYYKAMRNILFKIFPQLEHKLGAHRRHVYINTRR